MGEERGPEELAVQNRGVRCVKWRPPSPKERIEREGGVHLQVIPEEA